MSTTDVSQTGKGKSSRAAAIGASLVGGFLFGVVVTGVAAWMLMPGMMIVTEPSTLGFDETITALEDGVTARGWSLPGTMDMNQALAKHGQNLAKRVKVIKLCKADYAKDVLTTDTHVACLMPCSIAVWEDDGGEVYVSKMNTGLMGKMFGGNIAKVMGGQVARDEEAILAAVLEK